MAAQIIPFDFESNEVRTLLINDQPWFFAVDVCYSLNLRDTNKALIGLDDDEKREHEHYSGSGRKPVLINESGLYSLILRSRKAEAKRFKKWVTAEVLPTIRKHGHYSDDQGKMNTLLGQTIGTDGFRCLGAVLEGKLVNIPKPDRKRIKHHVWSQVHKAFSVVSAQDIPADKMDAARNFIAAYAIEGEWIGRSEHKEEFVLTKQQAMELTHLLHSVDWVNHRWHEGIGQGVKAINGALFARTVDHVHGMSRAARSLDAELHGMRQHFSYLGGKRPGEKMIA